MASIAPILPADVLADFAFPQREAAFFYGLFLRGHSPEELRRDIEVPAAVLPVVVTVRVELPVPVTVAGEKLAVVPVGKPLALNVTTPANPFSAPIFVV